MPRSRAGLPLFLLASCIALRCSGTSELHAPPSPPASVSRDGVLSFLAPPGWTEVAGDTTAAGSVLWLIRSDLASSISVREVHLDSVARAAARADGLRSLAELTLALQSKTGRIAPVGRPTMTTLDGKQFCMYDIAASSLRDTIRVVLFSAGARVYEATAIARAGQESGTRGVFEGLESLLRSLRW